MLLSSQIDNPTDCLIDSPESSDSSSSPPSKSSKKRKRTLKEVIAEIPSLENLKFKPLPVDKQAPQLNLPPNLDMTSSYSLFTLFFMEEIFEKISNSTNVYVQLHRETNRYFKQF